MHMLPELHSILGLLEGGFGQLRVLVTGDIMLDRYIHGEVDRISPEAPVPVIRHAQRYERAGGAANVAMNLAGLGCQTFLAGFWGSDTEQIELASIMAGAGIDTVGVVSSSLPTISKTRIVGRNQQLLRLDIESRERHPTLEAQRLLERATELAGRVDAVILSDYAKGALSDALCESVIRAARAAGVPVLADPKTPDFSKYAGATTVCPNLGELSMATGVPAYETDMILAAGQTLVAENDLEFLTVTMSEKGISVLHPDRTFHSPARAREVFDVSGAGDTVIATLAASLAGGLKIETAVELANLAAGVVVGKVGTVPIARHELIALLTPSTGLNAGEKILDLERIQKRVAEWRASGETIVFTNGCFDLIHLGHIKYFQFARRQGDLLVVGVNTDEGIRRLKGDKRPIITETDRLGVLEELESINYLVRFDEDTPLTLIEKIRPDVLVKGADYPKEKVVGWDLVESYGGRVALAPLVDGKSTSAVIQRILETHR